jgi:hypothetical protein
VPRWAPESQALGATAAALRRPSLWWCVVVGLYVASEIADDFTLLPSRWHRVLANGIDIVLILSVTVTLAGLAGGLLTRVTERHVPGGKVTGSRRSAFR